MKPIDFPEKTKTLSKPPDMTDEQCQPLPVFNDGTVCISCWQPSWRERLAIAFGRPVWLSIISGHTQPPALVAADYPFVTK